MFGAVWEENMIITIVNPTNDFNFPFKDELVAAYKKYTETFIYYVFCHNNKNITTFTIDNHQR